MVKSLAELPDDSGQLKRLIVEIRAQHAAELRERDTHHETQLHERAVQHEAQLRERDAQLEQLKEQIKLMIERHYGRAAEAAPGQGELFNEVEVVAATAVTAAPPVTARGHCRRGGRRPLPAHLPRLEIIHELAASERRCPQDGTELTEIGSEVSEQLEYLPATLRVLRRLRKKYACRHCESTIVRAPLPPSLLPKSQASPSLLAQIAIAKYQDGLPLHRQEAIFRRHGIELSRTTLANWLLAVGERLNPLLELMQRDLLTASVVHSDETTLQVLKEPGRRAEQRSYMWLNVTGSGPPIVRYHYAASRGRAVIERLLGAYRGTLVTDGYAAYDAVPARHAGCWAHARRKFLEALKVQSGAKTGQAQIGFDFIQKLFAFEHAWQPLDAATRHAHRQREARPLLTALKDWLDAALLAVAPQSLTGKALGYLATQWEKLTIFLDDGAIPIHNNLAENKIRPFVIGRKNWLFSDTVAGAHTSAALYSLIETAKANDLEPLPYLQWLFDVLPRISSHDEDALRELLPYRLDRNRLVTDLIRQYAPTLAPASTH